MSKNSSTKIQKTPTNQEVIDSYDFPSNAASTQDLHWIDSIRAGERG